MEDSVEVESKRKSNDEWTLEELSEKEQSPFFILDHGREIKR